MEGISRLLWGFVPYYVGGGKDPEWNLRLAKALAAGTDPEGEEYWGGFSDKDQKFVEMVAIAYGLLFAKESFWDVMSEEAQDHLAAYLYAINDYVLPECNWVLFAVLVNVALKKLGKPYSSEQLERYLQMTDSFYCGDGWYRDGDSNQKDYYISFAIHYYCLVYAAVCGDEDPERASLYKERAMVFAKQFIYWFDESGEALAFGRSLTYRFAQVAFFSACVLAGIEPFTPGQMKGLICRHMEQWLKKDIFDRDGILTIGYGYPNLIMAEAYNAPGSPYWGYKTFAILMLLRASNGTPADLREGDPSSKGTVFLPYTADFPRAQPGKGLEAEPKSNVAGISECHWYQDLKNLVRYIAEDPFSDGHAINMKYRDGPVKPAPVPVVRHFIPVKVLAGYRHVPPELPHQVCHKCRHGANALGNAVPPAVVTIRLPAHGIVIEVFLQHAPGNPEYMPDPKTLPVIYQDIVQHPADVVQLLFCV